MAEHSCIGGVSPGQCLACAELVKASRKVAANQDEIENTVPQTRAQRESLNFWKQTQDAQNAMARLELAREMIERECDQIRNMLLGKNQAYGNSALDPVRVFSKASPVEQILVRLDDKLSRISRGEDLGEDTIQDLIGYLILLRVARKQGK